MEISIILRRQQTSYVKSFSRSDAKGKKRSYLLSIRGRGKENRSLFPPQLLCMYPQKLALSRRKNFKREKFPLSLRHQKKKNDERRVDTEKRERHKNTSEIERICFSLSLSLSLLWLHLLLCIITHSLL